MSARVVDALRHAGAFEVLTIGGDVQSLKLMSGADRSIPDFHPGEGPLGGIITALSSASSDIVVVFACDTPDIDRTTVELLLRALAESRRAGVAAAIVGGRQQPLTGAWRVAIALPLLIDGFAKGERAPRYLLARCGVVDVEGIPDGAVTDLDRPEDLARYASGHRTITGDQL